MERWPTIVPEEQGSAHDQRRAEILDQARAVMRETGEFNLTEVARALGIQPPSLYEYFSGKMAIYDALFVQAYREFESYVRPSLERADSLWEVMSAGIESSIRFAREVPELFSLGFQRPPPGFEPSDRSDAIRQVILERIRAPMMVHLEATALNVDLSNEEVLDLLAAVSHGLIIHQVVEADGPPGDRERAERLASALIDSMRASWQVDPEGKPELNAWGLPASARSGL